MRRWQNLQNNNHLPFSTAEEVYFPANLSYFPQAFYFVGFTVSPALLIVSLHVMDSQNYKQFCTANVKTQFYIYIL